MKEILPSPTATTEYKKCSSKSDQWSVSPSMLSLMVAVGVPIYRENTWTWPLYEVTQSHTRNTGGSNQGQGHLERKEKIGEDGTENKTCFILFETVTNCHLHHLYIPQYKANLQIAMLPWYLPVIETSEWDETFWKICRSAFSPSWGADCILALLQLHVLSLCVIWAGVLIMPNVTGQDPRMWISLWYSGGTVTLDLLHCY